MSWEILYGIGALALGLGLAWGLLQNKRRNKANDSITEAATREEYQHPERYQETQEKFRAEVRR